MRHDSWPMKHTVRLRLSIQPIEINKGDKIHFFYLLEKKLQKKVRKGLFSSNKLNWP